MVDTDKAHAETSDVDDVPRHHRVQIARIDAVFLETSLENAERQTRAVDRHGDLLHHIRECPDVILMSVRQDDRLHHVLVFDQIGDVRNNEVDAEHVLLREHEPGVDDDDLVVHADGGHVLSDFAKSAERYDLHLLRIFPAIAAMI